MVVTAGDGENQFRRGSFTRIIRSAETSLSSCKIPEGQRISIRLAEAARAESEVYGSGARRCVSGSERNVVILHAAACRHLDSGADAIAVAGRPFELQFQPMRMPRTIVQPQLRPVRSKPL